MKADAAPLTADAAWEKLRQSIDRNGGYGGMDAGYIVRQHRPLIEAAIRAPGSPTDAACESRCYREPGHAGPHRYASLPGSPTDAALRDPQSFIPGYRVRFIELDTACAYLVSQGWAGVISFDEAVKVLGAASGSPEPVLERLRAAAQMANGILSRLDAQATEPGPDHLVALTVEVWLDHVRPIVTELHAALATHASPATLVPEGDQG